jgi:hypothetical protein
MLHAFTAEVVVSSLPIARQKTPNTMTRGRWKRRAMSREDLLPVYLSGLEQAKYELARAEKSSSTTTDPLEKIRWSLDAEIRRALVRVYDGLIVFVQQPQ